MSTPSDTYLGLVGLIDHLPRPPRARWTPERKAQWLAAFEAVLDYSIVVREATEPEPAEAPGDDG